MNFLQKIDFMMEKLGINKSKLSAISGVPYTTIDTFYKKGYENTKLSTIRKIADALDVSMDYLIVDTITDENYGKTNGFLFRSGEMDHIKKYRSLDPYGQEAVDGVLDVEYRRCREDEKARDAKIFRESRNQTEVSTEIDPEMEATRYIIPGFLSPMSAGTGLTAGDEYPEEFELTKRPPRGTSFIARVSGESMEPTYYDGDLVFVHAMNDIRIGQIGVFFMDGQQWIKERGDRELISHNHDPKYKPLPFTPDIRCQGIVLGVCDESYFEK